MKTRDPLIALRLPQPLLDLLDAEVRRRPGGLRGYDDASSRSAVVREALAAFFGLEIVGRRYLRKPG